MSAIRVVAPGLQTTVQDLGRTRLRLFDPQAVPPPLLRMGDHVRFVPEARR